MQVPPPQYQQQLQPKKNNTVLFIVLAAVAVCGCAGVGVLAAILFPVFSQANLAAKKTLALSHAKQSGLALIMYASDYDERLPLATEWMDLASPYSKDAEIFKSPLAKEKDPLAYGFAFRKALSRKNMSKVEDIRSWAMIFDSTLLNRNATSDLETLPNPGRYGFGDSASNVIGFADGHAKVYQANKIPALTAGSQPSIR
jgi:hypothetical protein